jgi:ABC-2 type transport system permease protein
MSSVVTIAKKEFSDLVSSKIVIFILAFYIIIFGLSFYNSYGSINIAELSSKSYYLYATPSILANPAGFFASTLIMIICYYGSLVAIGVGYSSMSGDADGKALGTLLVKPLYRDSIINGKLLGAFCFLFCIFWVSVAFYLAGLFLLFGGIIAAHLLQFLIILPVVFLIYSLSTMLFLSLSMLCCISFKNQSLALFTSFLSWIILDMLAYQSVMGNIVSFLQLDKSTSLFFNSLIFYNILAYVSGALINGKGSIFDTSSMYFSYLLIPLVALSLYCFVAILATYASFIRRDIS